MAQPIPVMALAVLLTGAVAVAQPLPPVREGRQRRIVLPASPGLSAPEVYVAPGVLTTLVFDVPLNRDSVDLDERVPLFGLVEPAERLLTLEPKAELGPKKKVGLRVRLKDGTAVALILASHPTQVDTRLEVSRPRSYEALEAEFAELQARCAASSPTSLVLARLLDATIRGERFEASTEGNTHGLSVEDGIGYRSRSWALVSISVLNLPGQRAWRPERVRLLDAAGAEVRGVSVQMDKPVLQPGERGLVVVETGHPNWKVGSIFRLELTGEGGGRPLFFDGVKL